VPEGLKIAIWDEITITGINLAAVSCFNNSDFGNDTQKKNATD
jgi:hypothetical protein